MDCIFKSYGFVPKNHVCFACKPLEMLLSSTGCSAEQATKYAKAILKAYRLLKIEDTVRDEKPIKRIKAKALSPFYVARTPRAIRNILKRTNLAVEMLEKSNADPLTYVEKLAHSSGEIFETAAKSKQQKEQLRAIGATLTGAIVVNDMVKDRDSDLRKGRFNPLNTRSQETTQALTKQYHNKFIKLAMPLFPSSLTAHGPRKPVNKLVYSDCEDNECGCCC